MQNKQLSSSITTASNTQINSEIRLINLGSEILGNALDLITFKGFSETFLYGINDNEKELSRRINLIFPLLYALQQKAFLPNPSRLPKYATGEEETHTTNRTQVKYLIGQLFTTCSHMKIKEHQKGTEKYKILAGKIKWTFSFLTQPGCQMLVTNTDDDQLKQKYDSRMKLARKVLEDENLITETTLTKPIATQNISQLFPATPATDTTPHPRKSSLASI